MQQDITRSKVYHCKKNVLSAVIGNVKDTTSPHQTGVHHATYDELEGAEGE